MKVTTPIFGCQAYRHALNFDSDSLPHRLPKEIGLYILQLKYPFLVSFEQFESGLPNPFFTPLCLELLNLKIPSLLEKFLPLVDIKEEVTLIVEKKEDQSSCLVM